MTSDDVSQHDDPRDRGGYGDDPALDEILEGRRRPETEDEMTLDRLLSALRAPGTADELRGLEATSAAFLSARAEAAAVPGLTVVGGTARRPLVAAGVAVAAVLASVTFVGAAAAAFTGNLPPAAQEAAHALFGAPAPDAVQSTEAQGGASSLPASTTHASGPAVSPTRPAVFGQCVAYTHRAPGVALNAVTLRNLTAAAAAAEGNPSIAEYCAGIFATASPQVSGHPTSSHQPTGRPTPGTKSSARATPSTRATPSARVTPGSTHKPSPAATGGVSPTHPTTAASGR